MKLRWTIAAVLSAWIFFSPASAPAEKPSADNPKRTNGGATASAGATNVVAEEYLQLAEYFGVLASQEQALAGSYQRLAAAYDGMPAPAEMEGALHEMKAEYTRLAEIEQNAAAAATTMAAYQRQMAGRMVHRDSGTGSRVNSGDNAFRR